MELNGRPGGPQLGQGCQAVAVSGRHNWKAGMCFSYLPLPASQEDRSVAPRLLATEPELAFRSIPCAAYVLANICPWRGVL
jgi:hypothetical protein